MNRIATTAVLFASLWGSALAEAPDWEGPEAQSLPNPFAAPTALRDWVRTSNLATIRDGVLRIDALRSKEPIAVFRRDTPLTEVRVTAEFMVEPAGIGERAFGLIFGSTDSGTYHCVHIDRREVVLCRVKPGEGRNAITRRGFDKPDGRWYRVHVEASGPVIRVSFEGKHLYTSRSDDLQPGYIGVYASASRVQVRGLEFSGRPVKLAVPWKQR